MNKVQSVKTASKFNRLRKTFLFWLWLLISCFSVSWFNQQRHIQTHKTYGNLTSEVLKMWVKWIFWNTRCIVMPGFIFPCAFSLKTWSPNLWRWPGGERDHGKTGEPSTNWGSRTTQAAFPKDSGRWHGLPRDVADQQMRAALLPVKLLTDHRLRPKCSGGETYKTYFHNILCSCVYKASWLNTAITIQINWNERKMKDFFFFCNF